MKKVIGCLAIMALLTAGACKKDHKDNVIANSIIGTWELHETSSSWVGPTYYNPGNGNTVTFSSNGNYAFAQNGQVTKTGTYVIEADGTVNNSVCLVMPAGTFTQRIIYDGNYTSAKAFVELADGKLSIIAGCYAYDAGHKEVYTTAGATDYSKEN